MWTTHFAESVVQSHQRNGSAHVPARDTLSVEALSAIGDGSGCELEKLASFEHCMHYNRQLARHSHSSSFEAKFFLGSRNRRVRNVLSVELRGRGKSGSGARRGPTGVRVRRRGANATPAFQHRKRDRRRMRTMPMAGSAGGSRFHE